MKQCRICKKFKPESEFYSDKRALSGLDSHCKKCHAAYKKPYKDTRIRIYTEAQKIRRNELRNLRRKNHPEIYQNEKESARKTLHYACKSGKVIKPLLCEKCGQAARLHGHHTDYSKPLEVIWLCESCHLKVHGKTLMA